MPLQIVNRKRFLLFVGTLTALLLLAFLGFQHFKKDSDQPELKETVYEALIQTKGRDSYKSDRKAFEDRKAFFENGDVMAIFPAGHAWSDTEREELIVKLKITPDEAQKLMEPETQDVEESGDETIQLRKYRLKMETIKSDPARTFTADVIETK